MLVEYDTSIDRSIEDVLFVKLKNKIDNSVLTLCVCYLPPEHSSRHTDVDLFFNEMMRKVYEYQNDGQLIICGDLNARIGCESDYIEGVDDIKPREVIDETLNSYGDHLLDFLINCNLYVLNGRLGIQDFTHVSKRGRSVVDYVCVPHEQLSHYSEFSVHTMTNLVNTFDLHGQKVSDHSVITWTKPLHFSTENINDVCTGATDASRAPKYIINDIPPSFLNCEESFESVMRTIDKIEYNLSHEQDVTKAYKNFVDLISSEMEVKLKKKRTVPQNFRKHKSRAKSY